MTRKTYLTDLSDAEWHRLSRLVPGPLPGGRPLKYPRRAILNAIFYLVRAGARWLSLAHAPGGLAAVADRLSLLPSVDPQRLVATSS